MFKAVISFSVFIILLAAGIAVDRQASAQSPAEFTVLKAAGNVALAKGTKPSTDKDGKPITVPDADAVVITPKKFHPLTGLKSDGQPTTYSIAGMEADITRMKAALAEAEAMLVELKAVK